MKFNAFVTQLEKHEGPAFLAVLIDPDKFNPALVKLANSQKVACFLVGGSKLKKQSTGRVVKAIKKISSIPVILFPGDEKQLTPHADGLFLPSLLSGRNPDYLIGKQVLMAPRIKAMKLPCLPMAYLLVDGKRVSSTQKVTKTKPLSRNNSKLILHTVLAAEQLGFKAIYLEAGSGASAGVAAALIKAVKKTTSLPLIVGGGIDSSAKAEAASKAGANMVVVGNAFEKDVYLLPKISSSL